MKSGKNRIHLVGSVLCIISPTMIPGFAVGAYLGEIAACATTALIMVIVVVKVRPHVARLHQGSGSPIPVMLVGLFFIGGSMFAFFPESVASGVTIVESESPFRASPDFLVQWFGAMVFIMGLGILVHGIACFRHRE